MQPINRRTFVGLSTASLIAASMQAHQHLHASEDFKFNYLVGSCMYGYASLSEILTEINYAGMPAIDIWPMVHGNQREQIDEIGEHKFLESINEHNIKFGCLSQYKLGPFDLGGELQFAKRTGCRTIVTNAKGPVDLKGQELKSAIVKFVDQFKPTLDAAAQVDVTIAIENHSKNMIATPDSILWLHDLCKHPSMSFAIAPYHLDQSPSLIADLIQTLGPSLSLFYAWQHGNGSMQAQPKDTELLQLPGKGNVDFKPIVQALKKIQFNGWIEIFMHSFPRGTAVHDSPRDVTNEIILARNYLESLIT